MRSAAKQYVFHFGKRRLVEMRPAVTDTAPWQKATFAMTSTGEQHMRWGLSWGATFPHIVEIQGMQFEVRAEKIGRALWNAYGTVNGLCVEASGASERAARCKWIETVQSMYHFLQVPEQMASVSGLSPETCEVLRGVERRLTSRPRLDR
jgi:hypothetical protein